MSAITVARICECNHRQSDHEYGFASECAYGWTNEPGEEACPCEAFVYHADLVAARLSTSVVTVNDDGTADVAEAS